MQSTEAMRTSVSRRNILYLPSSWQTNDHFSIFGKPDGFFLPRHFLKGRLHCEFFLTMQCEPAFRNAVSLFPQQFAAALASKRKPWMEQAKCRETPLRLLRSFHTLTDKFLWSSGQAVKQGGNDVFVKLLCNNLEKKTSNAMWIPWPSLKFSVLGKDL